MALFLVLEDARIGGTAFRAGSLLDDTTLNVQVLQASGLAAVIYAPVMVAPRAAYLAQRGSQPQKSSPDGDLTALLLAAGVLGGATPVAARRDHSVNGAFVDNYNTTLATLRTQTSTNPAGGYNGGGTGNKAILGHFLPAPMLLADLVTVEWLVDLLQPEADALAPNIQPYANFVAEMDPVGDPGNYSILAFGDVDSESAYGLSLGVHTSPTPTQRHLLWTAGSPTSNVQVVLLKKMIGASPAPPGAIEVAAAQGPLVPPGAYASGTWFTWAYSLSAIVARYPLARLVNASSADGGMPKAPTITAAICLVCGSSGNLAQNAVRVLDWKLNGEAI